MVEETGGRWPKELLNLPAKASFALVTGCQMAHVTCLATAPRRARPPRGWNAEQDGLAGAPAIRIFNSVERPSSLPRAVRLLGLGEHSIRVHACDIATRIGELPGARALSRLQSIKT